jgi:hypothetical protein
MILIPLAWKNVYLPAGSVPPLSHLASCIRIKSDLFFPALSQLSWTKFPYTDTLQSACQSSFRSSFLAYVVYPKYPAMAEPLCGIS